MKTNRITDTFDQIFRKYTPDPFLFAVILTGIVALVSLVFTDASALQVVEAWGGGFWSLMAFTLQMTMILLGGSVVALAPPVQSLLLWVIRPIRTQSQAILAATFISIFASWMNWGLGLVIGAVVSVKIAKQIPGLNFRLLVASAYSGFIVWHGGLSGSIPLLLNTPGNFSEEWLGRTIPLSETLFSGFNLLLLFSLIVFLPLLNLLMSRSSSPSVQLAEDFLGADTPDPLFKKQNESTPAEKLETSRWMTLITAGGALAYVGAQIVHGKFTLDLNQMNFVLLFLGILLHGNIRSFLNAVTDSASKVGPILVQYPFYGGIMNIMMATGLAAVISKGFIAIATAETFPLLTFYSAGFVNFFVPSGGGQWAIQGPIVIPAAQALGADLTRSILAVAWGDAWTNLAQPFWALPVLAIAGLRARDIMGYCVVALFATGILISAVFLLA